MTMAAPATNPTIAAWERKSTRKPNLRIPIRKTKQHKYYKG
jgi:hypothetical protein